jgi:hypothetical protein
VAWETGAQGVQAEGMGDIPFDVAGEGTTTIGDGHGILLNDVVEYDDWLWNSWIWPCAKNKFTGVTRG